MMGINILTEGMIDLITTFNDMCSHCTASELSTSIELSIGWNLEKSQHSATLCGYSAQTQTCSDNTLLSGSESDLRVACKEAEP
ncbi:hypothetical protein P4O66_008279 [Electrophorus voltai]|uniref:Uncharacterized protein n=1 Tax=Electrophorus voltai TaxID=2609070 RepID=A0AAD8ZFF6_9TELE|nr:hypothetical protein P4O66_008279 [Electrophorus voltai]